MTNLTGIYEANGMNVPTNIIAMSALVKGEGLKNILLLYSQSDSWCNGGGHWGTTENLLVRMNRIMNESDNVISYKAQCYLLENGIYKPGVSTSPTNKLHV